jgi:hypothetical protein
MAELDRFEVYIYVADAKDGDDLHRYVIEHWFRDLPGIETVAALLDEAKRNFATLYPGVETEDHDVELRRLRAKDLLPSLPGTLPTG